MFQSGEGRDLWTIGLSSQAPFIYLNVLFLKKFFSVFWFSEHFPLSQNSALGRTFLEQIFVYQELLIPHQCTTISLFTHFFFTGIIPRHLLETN